MPGSGVANGVAPWLRGMPFALGSAGMLLAAPLAADAAAAKAQSYLIHAGSLSEALDALASQSDVQVIYAPNLVAGKTSRGIRGRYTPLDALKRLLAGTGLGWTAVNDFTFVLLPAAPAPAPKVVAKPTPAASPEQARVLGTIRVSGSLIDNIDIQTATPTYTITAAQIKARGFGSVAEVLQNSVFATGSVQGQQRAGAFTQGAQPISLFGLNPQFTLILVDGKPVADFGRLYNGTVNFTSVSNLPVSLIDHIDVMPGGSSTIYGSQAIGGVINIVTLSHLDGGEASVRIGRYPDGGGANQRVTFAYGGDLGTLHVLGALEFDNASPIWGYQRTLTSGSDSGPGGGPPSIQAGILDFGTASSFTGAPQGYMDPPAGCDGRLFNGSTTLVSGATAGLGGHYCGSQRVDGYQTYANQTRGYDSMLKLRYNASDSVRLYADAIWNWQQQKWFPGVLDWAPDDFPEGAIEDATTGHILYPEKFFAPEEMPGGAAGQMVRQEDVLYQFDVGANGHFGKSDWTWDIYYLRTGDRTEVVEPLAIGQRIDTFFGNVLGPFAGIDPVTGLNTYLSNDAAFFQPVTPAQYAGFTQNVGEFSNTWINDTRATLGNTRLFHLPGGDAGFATLVEGGNEAWYQPVNPLYVENAIFEHAATGGGGRRSHAAAAFELNLPVLRPLTLDLSGRYDHYSLDQGSSNHRFTYKAGIEYRPVHALLFRGNYTTAFKAPDLSALFLGPTDYFTNITDYYQCALAQSNACSNFVYSVKGTAMANRALQPTTAQSWTLGTVWSPIERLDLSIDYLHIAIRNEVIEQSLDMLMFTDAQCLLGQLPPLSTQCQALTNPTTGQVQRVGGAGPVTGVTTYYANLADEVAKSIIASGRYRFGATRMGTFGVQFDYNDMLKHDYQLAPGQPRVDRLGDPQASAEFKSILSGTLDWTSPDGRWTSTLYGHRYGPTPNLAATSNGAGSPGASHLHPWITFNWSVSYTATPRLDLSLLIDNIADRMPPVDSTHVAYPYFNDENYNVYGRSVMLQADLKLDGVAH